MIDTVANLLFRCAHRRLTSPLTPVSKAGVPHGETYVVCLDCGKQFPYDLAEMRIGKPIDNSNDACVIRPKAPDPKAKLKLALWASVPLAVLIGAALKTKKPRLRKAEDPETKSAKADAHEPDGGGSA
jgi:hypothetical protein